MNSPLSGQVVAAFSRQYLVELANGELLPCLTHGKKSELACGDQVHIQRTGETQGVIENILPRHTLLYRSDAFRQKLIAANVTQIIFVVASEPAFSDEVLARCLIAAHEQHLDVLIVLNKCDLLAAAAKARTYLQPYCAIGYRVLELSAKQDIAPLLPYLQGHSSVLTGQSGMGKSTLINALLPQAQTATREISTALNSGKHTTTHARLYHLNANSHLIDCPGVQAFGLHHLDFSTIEAGFIEFAAYRGLCRFNNCHHTHEPDCALKNAVEEGKIDARRLQLFQEISRKLS
ncbi:MAG: ribosome small subunit-dependent GTPase A [Gallionellaceae bacterium]|nr:ribosome small subunit-dependent GTPase A [Gallionellaceae bacterium]